MAKPAWQAACVHHARRRRPDEMAMLASSTQACGSNEISTASRFSSSLQHAGLWCEHFLNLEYARSMIAVWIETRYVSRC